MPAISETALLASLCRESFYDFLLEFWHTVDPNPLVRNWHLKFLCKELQKVAERVFNDEPKEYDLVINIPPGTSKSTICSQMFPVWCWTRMPSAKFICVSYAHDVAVKDSLKSRDIVNSELYHAAYPEIVLREDLNKTSHFANTRTGFRMATGVGGKLMGFHGHFLVVDDPLNPQEASSDAELKSVLRWMSETLPTRKVSKENTPLILIQQRLHQADPSGLLLERGGVRHICLPGEQTDDVSPPECVARYERRGGLLDPNRLSRRALESMRKEMGLYGYSAQVLQRPTPLEGGLFKIGAVKKVDHEPDRVARIVRSWDKAGTEGAGKFTVGVKMCMDRDGNFGILDVVRGQWGSTRREQIIRATAEADGPDVPVLIEIEGGSGGKESGENTVRNLAGFRVIPFHPTGDKEARAYGFASQLGAGNVWVLNRPWAQAFLEELQWFPNGKYSDQVDASSGGFNWIARKRRKVGGFSVGVTQRPQRGLLRLAHAG